LTRLANTDKLLQDIIDADIYVYGQQNKTPRERAKSLRSRLFNHKINKKTAIIQPNKHLGCDWYDKLGDMIYDTLLMLNIDNSHLYFSTQEQIIIQQAIDIIKRGDVLLNMHDGLILKPNTITPIEMMLLNDIDPYITFKHNII
jgi:hypothetical protein